MIMTMRDLGALNPIGSGRWFGRHYCLDPMHSTITNPYEICVEIATNMTGELPATIGGMPAVRGLGNTGGPQSAYLNTQTVGGLDAGTLADGDFLNDYGVFLIEYDGNMRTRVAGQLIRLWLPALETAPAVGDLMTQNTSCLLYTSPSPRD